MTDLLRYVITYALLSNCSSAVNNRSKQTFHFSQDGISEQKQAVKNHDRNNRLAVHVTKTMAEEPEGTVWQMVQRDPFDWTEIWQKNMKEQWQMVQRGPL